MTAKSTRPEPITGVGIDHHIDPDGYQAITLTGMLHHLSVMPDGLDEGLLVQVSSGLSTATARLSQEHIDALHTFLGHFASHPSQSAPRR